MRSRDDRFRAMLAHRAAASVLEASLKDEAAEEYEQHGSRVSWEWAGTGSVIASLTRNAITITDQTAFMEWLGLNYPHQVREVTRLEVINPKWVEENLFKQLEPVPLYDADGMREVPPGPGDRRAAADPNGGSLVPGVRWVKGGGLRCVSVKPDQEVARRYIQAAAAVLVSPDDAEAEIRERAEGGQPV